MYSDPYQGSYHLRCLTEAEILSSWHYRRMTSAQRHGSNYIIQAHNTPAARRHQRPSTLSFLSPFFLHFCNFCSPPPQRSSILSAAQPRTLQSIQPLAAKVEGFTMDYDHLNCLGDFNQRVLKMLLAASPVEKMLAGGFPHTCQVFCIITKELGVDFLPLNVWSVIPRGMTHACTNAKNDSSLRVTVFLHKPTGGSYLQQLQVFVQLRRTTICVKRLAEDIRSRH